MIQITKPDIINRKTKLINLGQIEEIIVDINDELINPNKKSNDSITSGYWITIDGELYYFKVPTYTQEYINELLGERISLHFQLPTVNNKLATALVKMDGHEQQIYGLVSKWARKPDYEYQTLQDAIYGETSQVNSNSFDIADLSILTYIDRMYNNQPICEQFRTFIIRDFFTQETDRLESEIMLATKDGITELGYVLDYECEWGKQFRTKYVLFNYLRLDPNNEKVISQLQNDPYFQQALKQAMNIDVVKMLSEIRKEFNINLIDYDIKLYERRQQEMKNYIKSKKMII